MGASVQQRSGGGGGGRRRRRGGARPMSEINVTPFVDVMLVLLIIFMVAAPLLTVGVPLDLPDTVADPLPTEQEEPLTVNIDADAKIYLQDTEHALEGLMPKLAAIRQARGNKDGAGKVFLRADKAVPHGVVAQVMAMLRASGFRSIGIVTDQASAAASSSGTQDQ